MSGEVLDRHRLPKAPAAPIMLAALPQLLETAPTKRSDCQTYLQQIQIYLRMLMLQIC
jgi:hypothetical protein